jgi:hypothetical protein
MPMITASRMTPPNDADSFVRNDMSLSYCAITVLELSGLGPRALRSRKPIGGPVQLPR